jgi:DNA adenine methylase
MIKPVLRYPGGKARIAPWIVEHLPPHSVYIEPFFGGGSVLFTKTRSPIEVANDIDDRVVTLFRVLRDQPDELVRVLELTPYSRAEYEESDEPTDDPIEASRRYLCRVWMAHAGKLGSTSGFRNGWSGGNPQTRGSSARVWAGLPDRIRFAVDRLQGVVIERRPALKLIGEWQTKDAAIYCDPPYMVETLVQGRKLRVDSDGDWARYYRFTMNDADHLELMDALDRHPGPVLLSGYRTDLYDQRLEHWRRVDRKVHAYRQAERIESLWLNPVAAEMAKQPILMHV